MRGTLIILGVLLTVFASGCRGANCKHSQLSHHKCRPLAAAAPTYNIKGMVAPVGSDFAFADFETSLTNGSTFGTTLGLGSGEILETDQYLKLTLSRPHMGYFSAVFGPPLGGPRAQVEVAADAWIELLSGWALVWGRYPRVRTNWVSADAAGTTYVAQLVSINEVNFFYIGGTYTVDIKCKESDVRAALGPAMLYAKATLSGNVCSITTQATIPNSFTAFIERARKIGTAAKWDSTKP